ncbi:MAG: FeS-binding protein [Armatimonadetes bacterium]|nr:FeS-binding protein [Armatimonadota bacterium]MBS1725831.1 NIL domain-containing protein [Armatimonadota bacterium]
MTSVLVNVSGGSDAAKEPWIWRICKDFNVKVNIVKANVDTDYGSMQIELSGAIEDIQRTIAWLMTTGLHVESQQRAVGA